MRNKVLLVFDMEVPKEKKRIIQKPKAFVQIFYELFGDYFYFANTPTYSLMNNIATN
ncbi:hypothetical protein GCM10007966_01030 [Legionella impletisoli]|uniref:Uncharacterized protein n=1 Tax=Legionella impletisoli TaxID=343510 RepID=A0A917N7T9_9GAMM|nr:hypothetical protein GCM10007966_01030 [Legionella impletisoli]